MPQLRLSPMLAAAGFAVLLGLSACGSDLSRTFGLTRDAPDEFQVTTRAPLSMPPDYTLRPPRPGATRPQEPGSRGAAESALAPQAALAAGPGPASPGQQALVTAAGKPAPPDIRRQIDEDAALDAGGSSFTDKLMFWRTPTPPGVVVDPQKEAQRLRENAALGQSADQGDTPIIRERQKSLWERLF
jgi:hypothetical protein